MNDDGPWMKIDELWVGLFLAVVELLQALNVVLHLYPKLGELKVARLFVRLEHSVVALVP